MDDEWYDGYDGGCIAVVVLREIGGKSGYHGLKV